MLVSEKEQRIKEKIQEITGVNININEQVCFDLVKDFRVFKIKKILLISSSSNYFQIEEEGGLKNLFTEWNSISGQEISPEITHVETGKECLKRINTENFDLIIIFNKLEDMLVSSLSKSIKENTSTPIVFLGNDINETNKIKKENKSNISRFFTWNGDGKIIPVIIQYFEDLKNIQNSSPIDFKKCILLIGDSIPHNSSYLSLINEEIKNFLKKTINDQLSFEQKMLRYKRRPFVIHTDDFEEGIKLFEKYKDDMICILTDNYLEENGKKKQIGAEITNRAPKEKPDLPVLIQSSQPFKTEEIKNKKIKFILKTSYNRTDIIRKFIIKSLGFLEIILQDDKGEEIFHIRNMNDFKEALKIVDKNEIFKIAKQNKISTWLKNIGELELSNKCLNIERELNDVDDLKNQLMNLIEEYNYSVSQVSISSFSQKIDDPLVKISRIGEGSLGGKARGLAFIAKILSKYIPENLFPNLKITIPRSIVLSTDIFDIYMDHNHLSDLDFAHISDARIAAKFMEANLPAVVLGDLRAFIKSTRKPLIVRSSGLLEDSLMQPFAGIYESVLFPNESWETDTRFQEVCNSIKYVYSSTYFEKARTYIKNTPKHIGDEKMAVLIQEVVGEKYDNFFYPTISGVAKSYNYYPSGPCTPEEGIVYLALGLGKAIVDGGSSFAFCPEKPKAPLFGTPKQYMRYAQTKYYALNLKSVYRFANFNEEITLDKLDIDIAKKHGVIDKIVSTYIQQDDQLYPGFYENGYLVVDFAPIVNYDEIPLVKAIKLLLQISEIALGYPVEIEFAINIPKDKNKSAELIILQIRNMIPPEKKIDININEIPREKTIIYSENALGNGVIENIKDIVYVDQEKFDLSNSNQVVNQIKEINTKLMEKNKPYILIGPGRWGSTDPWLGIPVIWSDIAGVKVIIETPYKERYIDPSQGSHFFHDMMASQVVYLITKKEKDIDIEWLKKQKLVEETEFIKQISIQKPLKTIVDGKIGKGVIIEEKKFKK